MRYSPEEIAEMTEFEICHVMDELNAEAEELGYADDSNKVTHQMLADEMDRREAVRMAERLGL